MMPAEERIRRYGASLPAQVARWNDQAELAAYRAMLGWIRSAISTTPRSDERQIALDLQLCGTLSNYVMFLEKRLSKKKRGRKCFRQR